MRPSTSDENVIFYPGVCPIIIRALLMQTKNQGKAEKKEKQKPKQKVDKWEPRLKVFYSLVGTIIQVAAKELFARPLQYIAL